ncbi:methyltransferase domain-containing protein [bacterium]|nr:methyltransferase domain-containing protein [candidate division CSSED10-310 bacterium]
MTDTLPFDIYQRYEQVARIIARLNPGEDPVLDVGGQQRLLARFLHGRKVVVADRAPQPADDMIQADGCALPFKARSFSIVVSVDTLEHVPPEGREPFLRELIRVADQAVVVAFPRGDDQVAEAERLVRDLVERIDQEPHPYLEEHDRHGLPAEDLVCRLAAEAGLAVRIFPNGYLPYWLPGMLLNATLERLPAAAEVLHAVNRYYNRFHHPADGRAPAYRSVAVLHASAGSLDQLAPIPPAAPIPTARDLRPLAAAAAGLIEQHRESIHYSRHLLRELESIRGEVAAGASHREELAAKLEELLAERAVFLARIDTMEHALNAAHRHVDGLEKHLEKVNGELHLSRSQQEEAGRYAVRVEQEKLAVEDELTKARDYVDGLRRELDARTAYCTDVERREQDIAARCGALETKLHESNLEAMERIATMARESETAIAAGRRYAEQVEAVVAKKDAELASAAEGVRGMTALIEGLEKELDAARQERARLVALYEEASAYAHRVEGDLESMRLGHEELAARYMELSVKFGALEEAHRILPDIRAKFEEAARYSYILEEEMKRKNMHIIEIEGYVDHLIGEIARIRREHA